MKLSGGYIVIKTHNADEIVNLLKYGYNGIWGRKGGGGGCLFLYKVSDHSHTLDMAIHEHSIRNIAPCSMAEMSRWGALCQL